MGSDNHVHSSIWPDTGPELPSPAAPRYTLRLELGQGGMGEVYLAYDNLLAREVALKYIRPDRMDPELLARLQVEARALAALDHPHVVKIYDFGEVRSPAGELVSSYLALEYVPGSSLAHVVKQGPLQIPDWQREAARFLLLLTGAIQHAHERGIVHRDLKPANVLLAKTGPATALGGPKVTDFGLARQVNARKRLTELTHGRATILGTPLYMAPEQADGLPDVGAPADVYALGVILYQLLTGRVPFTSASLPELLALICEEPPTPPRRLRADVPPELEKICLDCLEKAPERRPTTAELTQRLEAYLHPAQEPPAPRRPRVWLPSPRARLALGAGVLGFALMLLGLWLVPAAPNEPTQLEILPSATTLQEEVITLPGGEPLKLVGIPATGAFPIGSPPGEGSGNEKPAVKAISSFHLAAFETTQEQYQAVMGHNPSYFSHAGAGRDSVAGRNTNTFPVESVTWGQAVEFCRSLSELDAVKRRGWMCRLPREAEWEYACRGGSATYQIFHFGATLSAKQANVQSDDPLNRTTTVGSHGKNGFGLFDMHGNVWEWCADGYEANYAKLAPLDPVGPVGGKYRIIRGGSWMDVEKLCRSAKRSQWPTDKAASNVGFRVAMVPIDRK